MTLVLGCHLHFRVSHLKELFWGHVCLHIISINSSVFVRKHRGRNFQEYDALSPPSWCYPPPLPCRWTPGSCQSGWWSCGHTGPTWQQCQFTSGLDWTHSWSITQSRMRLLKCAFLINIPPPISNFSVFSQTPAMARFWNFMGKFPPAMDHLLVPCARDPL